MKKENKNTNMVAIAGLKNIGAGKFGEYTINDGRENSKDLISRIAGRLEMSMEGKGNWKKGKNEKSDFLKYDIKFSTPALKIASERGVLNEINYTEIKKGGLVVLEKYTNPPKGVQNMYDIIKELQQPIKVVIIEKDEERFRSEVNYKKNMFAEDSYRFKMENVRKVLHSPESLEDEINNPSNLDALEEVLGTKEAQTQFKTLGEIFNA